MFHSPSWATKATTLKGFWLQRSTFCQVTRVGSYVILAHHRYCSEWVRTPAWLVKKTFGFAHRIRPFSRWLAITMNSTCGQVPTAVLWTVARHEGPSIYRRWHPTRLWRSLRWAGQGARLLSTMQSSRWWRPTIEYPQMDPCEVEFIWSWTLEFVLRLVCSAIKRDCSSHRKSLPTDHGRKSTTH